MERASRDFFCAANATGGVDTCQGDSGGPLVCYSNSRGYVTGITSFGVGCNDDRYPGAYTNVANYREWILESQKSEDFCEEAATNSSCGGVFKNSPGLVRLRTNPETGTYFNNEFCKWEIRAPEGMNIAFRESADSS